MILLTIIIPSFNRATLLKETLKSIKDQRALLAHEIIIVDNMSSDGTLDVVTEYTGAPIELIREDDSGIYSAVAKGIQRSSGKYICYINCGDIFDPYFFSTVIDVNKDRPNQWYMGLPTSRTVGYATDYVRAGFFTSARLIKMGYHNGSLDHYLQQESIFWHRRFSRELDLEKLSKFRLAGDAYMWLCFAEVSEPVLLGLVISGYTHHASPLSSNRQLYKEEFESLYSCRHRVSMLLKILTAVKRILAFTDRLMNQAILRASR